MTEGRPGNPDQQASTRANNQDVQQSTGWRLQGGRAAVVGCLRSYEPGLRSRAPVEVLGILSYHNVEIHLLQLAGDGSGVSVSDGPVVQFNHRCEVSCRAGQEDLIG